MVLQTWIKVGLKMDKIPDKAINFLSDGMKNWKVELMG